MKIATKTATTLIQGKVESVEMTLSKRGIIAAQRMFRDQIYTHKAWAVVREILANAIDEHDKHGIKQPVLVTLPTMEDPHFRVRDFALGLNKKNVFGVFFQYFESTKDKDNNSIGGFGIGAKSPLAYADVFFVTSYHGGQKTSYIANVNGEASTAHCMDLQDSSETGIEVSVPVKVGDIKHFESLVNEFIKFSKADIEISNGEQTKESIEWEASFEGFGYVGKYETLFPSDIAILIKGIRYKVDATNEIKNPFQFPILLEIDAEEGIEIHPSRERIELSTRNINKVNRAIEDLKNEAIEKVKSAFSKADTARDKFEVKCLSRIFYDTNTIKSACPNITLAEWFDCHSKNVCWMEWSENACQKISVNKMSRDFECKLKPGGKKKFSSWYARNNEKTEGEIIIIPKKSIVYNKIIAFCEKNGINGPIFFVKDETVPESWVEGSDYWIFNEDEITKDEIKNVRSRYVTSSLFSSSPNRVERETVMGYSKNKRNDCCKLSFDRIKKLSETEQIVLADFSDDHFHDILASIFHEVTGKTLIFCFKSNRTYWKNCGVEYEEFDNAKFKKACETYCFDNQAPDVSIPLDFSKLHSYYVGSRVIIPYNQTCSLIKKIYEDTKEDPKKKQRIVDTLNLFHNLPAFEMELVKIYNTQYFPPNLPSIKKKIQQIANKVFG